MFASYSCLARRAAAPGAAAASVALWSETRLASAASTSTISTAVSSSSTCTIRTISRLIATSSSRTAVSATNNTTRRLFSSSSSSTTTPTGFVAWYEGHLSRQPVLTKAITGSLLWSIGDGVAQTVPDMAAGASYASLKDYDWARTGRACFYGFAIHAPLSHLHFNFLEYMTVKGGFKGLQMTVFKTVMEQFVYWSWVSNCLYHGAMGAMQGQSLQQTTDYIKDVIWDTQKAQWLFWIPVQLINFRFTPVRHQLNVVLATSIVWTALLSMWYPPIADNDDDKQKSKVMEEIPVM